MSRVKTPISLVLATLATAVLAVGCSGGSSGSPKSSTAKLPSGATLLQESSTATKAVTSLSFDLTSTPGLGLTVSAAQADLLRNGNAKGNATATEMGLHVQVGFVTIGKAAYLKGLTAGWEKTSLATVAGIYDPGEILDPNGGLAELLATATGAKTIAAASVDGQQAYEVHATLIGADVDRLVPGISKNTPADIWIATSNHRTLKAVLDVAKGSKSGTVTVTFSNFNVAFAITPPK